MILIFNLNRMAVFLCGVAVTHNTVCCVAGLNMYQTLHLLCIGTAYLLLLQMNMVIEAQLFVGNKRAWISEKFSISPSSKLDLLECHHANGFHQNVIITLESPATIPFRSL